MPCIDLALIAPKPPPAIDLSKVMEPPLALLIVSHVLTDCLNWISPAASNAPAIADMNQDLTEGA